jgi:hypothetical protein
MSLFVVPRIPGLLDIKNVIQLERSPLPATFRAPVVPAALSEPRHTPKVFCGSSPNRYQLKMRSLMNLTCDHRDKAGQ